MYVDIIQLSQFSDLAREINAGINVGSIVGLLLAWISVRLEQRLVTMP